MSPVERAAFRVRAIRPTLFNATLHPEFIPGLVLANLMTPRLWAWADTIRTDPAWAGADSAGRLRLLHRFLNKRFFHPTGTEFGRIWGLQERERIVDQDEREASDYAMRMIVESLRNITDPAFWTFSFLPSLQHGQFPLYVYPTVDTIAALPSLLPEADRRVLGVTCCLDECVLAASLALATGVCGRDDFAFFGSPAHYTLMVRTSGGPVWFNAKRECFTCNAWAGVAGADPGATFLHRLFFFDRLITATASALYPDGPCHDPGGILAGWVEEAERFVGAPAPWLRPVPPVAGSAASFDSFPAVPVDGRWEGWEAAVVAAARAEPAPVAEAGLLAFRHPEFCDRADLGKAATAGFRVFLKAAEVLTPGDAEAIAESIPGPHSIFGETGRVALPDEVLAFQTGSASERQLLRDTLLRLAPKGSQSVAT